MNEKKDFKMDYGYLYRVWKGKLMEYKGEVCHNDEGHLNSFFIVNEQGVRIKSLLCSPIEGLVFSGLVWLKESDKRKAAEIFIERETQEIAELKIKIDYHEHMIDTLLKEKES